MMSRLRWSRARNHGKWVVAEYIDLKDPTIRLEHCFLHSQHRMLCMWTLKKKELRNSLIDYIMESIKWNVGLWDPMYDPAMEIKQEEMDNDKDKVPKWYMVLIVQLRWSKGLPPQVVVHYFFFLGTSSSALLYVCKRHNYVFFTPLIQWNFCLSKFWGGLLCVFRN